MIAEKSGTITHAQILTLSSTNALQLVAAPGSGRMMEVVSAVFFFVYTAAYVGGDTIYVAIGPTGGSATEPLDTTFLQGTADMVGFSPGKWNSNVWDYATYINQGLYLRNTGVAYTGGNAANVVRYRLTYRIWTPNL